MKKLSNTETDFKKALLMKKACTLQSYKNFCQLRLVSNVRKKLKDKYSYLKF